MAASPNLVGLTPNATRKASMSLRRSRAVPAMARSSWEIAHASMGLSMGLAGGDGKKTPTTGGRGRGRCRGHRLGHCGGSCGLWTTRRGLRSLPVHAQRGMLTVRGARAVMLWGFNSDEVIGRIEQLDGR